LQCQNLRLAFTFNRIGNASFPSSDRIRHDEASSPRNGVFCFFTAGALAQSPTVQFASATYYTTGTPHEATVVVTFLGDRFTNSSTIEVGYHTGGGTATEDVDYTAASGTLTFPAGVNSQSFTVPILANPLATGAVTVLVHLTDTVNAGDGPIRNATLTIWDSPPRLAE
jgi:Calx-beta domain